MGNSKLVELGDEYDFIICGASIPGCIIAIRIAEDLNAKILLLEAGSENRHHESSNSLDFHSNHGRKEDFDDWGMEPWTGDKTWEYMDEAKKYFSKQAVAQNAETSNLSPTAKHIKDALAAKNIPYHCVAANATIPPKPQDILKNSPKRSNITLKTFHTVSKVLLSESSDPLTATGVCAVRTPPKQKDGNAGGETEVIYHASKEIVIAAGVINTPAILLRSGIGPAEDLVKEQVGIKPIVDLSGVGRGSGMLRLTTSLNFGDEGGGRGNGVVAYTRLPINDKIEQGEDRLHKQPHVSVLASANCVKTTILEPRQLSTISLPSQNPLKDPITAHHPPSIFYDALISAANAFISDLTSQPQSQSSISENVELLSTAAAGLPINEDAVVDERLNVRGIKGLRVADLSCIPSGVRISSDRTVLKAGIGVGAAGIVSSDCR